MPYTSAPAAADPCGGIRPIAPGANIAADKPKVYFNDTISSGASGAQTVKITNTGTAPDRLIGGSVDSARKVEIHQMTMEGGVAKMRQLPNGLEIKPGDTVELKPGSFHLMFVGIKQPFEQGKPVKGTLEFEKAGKVEVEYDVQPVGGSPKGEHGAHQGH